MIYPHSEVRFISPEMEYGVVATEFIPKGTITWAYDQLDRCFTPAVYGTMDKAYQDLLDKYCYRDHTGNFILCWDNARYVNHSFHSNCLSTAYGFELAVRDIYPGEQLTDDYGYLNCLEPFECLPEPDTSRTWVMPDDLLHFYKYWDARIMDAFQYFSKVPQPLSFLIEPATMRKAHNIASGFEPMDSILNCFYNEDESLMQRKEELLQQMAMPQLVKVF